MNTRLQRTSGSIVPTIARVALGVVILPHGMQKVLGSFGGPGLSVTLDGFTAMGIPVIFGILDLIAEFLGGIALIVGFYGRVAAFAVAMVMVVAVTMVHHPHFFMNWSGGQPIEGFEYHILAIALALIVMIAGSGRWSIDRWMRRESVD